MIHLCITDLWCDYYTFSRMHQPKKLINELAAIKTFQKWKLSF